MFLVMDETAETLPAGRPNAQILDRCIAAIAQSAKDAFTQLYHLTRAAAYSFALSLLKHSNDAEDILHDCYLSVYSNTAGYQSNGKPMA